MQALHLLVPGSEHPGFAQVSMAVIFLYAAKSFPGYLDRLRLSKHEMIDTNQHVKPPQIIHESEGIEIIDQMFF